MQLLLLKDVSSHTYDVSSNTQYPTYPWRGMNDTLLEPSSGA